MTTAVRTPTKPRRFLLILHRERHGLVIGMVRQTARIIKGSCYIVSPVEAAIPGMACSSSWEVEKEDGTVYQVQLGGRLTRCDCPGFVGHARCKHSAALDALAARGELSRIRPWIGSGGKT